MGDIVSLFQQFLENNQQPSHDFRLFKYTDKLFLGVDKDGYVSIVCVSSMPNRSQLRQKTRLISIECNVKVNYCLDGETIQNIVHVIRCYSTSQKEKNVFLELVPLFEEASNHDDQIASLLDTVSILSSFFANKSEPSDSELQGLYAELLAIKQYQSAISLGDYWQSNDRMKFDFSITDKVKVEVKSTTKNERKHHFRHEQLAHETYDIFVVSYMFRQDDEGTSLFDLIETVKPSVMSDPRRLITIEKYIKNTSEDRLRQCRFNEQLASYSRRIYKAQDIPRFAEQSPVGVTDAEYDCNLETANSIDESDFISFIQQSQSNNQEQNTD